MNKKIYLILFSAALIGCHSSSKKNSSSQNLSGIRVGMSFTDVVKLAGAPDTIIHLGIVEDTFHNQTKTDEWVYSENQIVTIVNDTVFAVDLDAIETQRRIQHIIDSAKGEDGDKPYIRPSQ